MTKLNKTLLKLSEQKKEKSNTVVGKLLDSIFPACDLEVRKSKPQKIEFEKIKKGK